MSTIIQNAVYIPSQRRYYKSANRHDFVTFTVNGEQHFIDGGIDYIRSSVIENPKTRSMVIDYNLSSMSTPDDIRQKLLWGTYGKKGNKPLTWKLVRNLSIGHLKAIVDTQPISPDTRAIMSYWLNKKIAAKK